VSDSPLAQLVAPPIFVVGQNRSGTTWVFDLLTHPDDVAGVFESQLFTHDSGLGGILHWAHWNADLTSTAERVAGRKSGLGQLADNDEVLAVGRELAQRWLARALKPSDRYLVEKSPNHLFSALEISEVFPDARFICVIRDGRDVAVSAQAAVKWAPGAIPEELMSVGQLARRWQNSVTASAGLLDHFGADRYMEIAYERLHAEPKAAAADLFRFCGFEAGEDAIDAALAATRFEGSFKGGEDHFRRAGRTGDWRERFTLRERLAFERAGGPALRARGYETSRWWWLRRPSRPD
jgi:hypothetical protein